MITDVPASFRNWNAAASVGVAPVYEVRDAVGYYVGESSVPAEQPTSKVETQQSATFSVRAATPSSALAAVRAPRPWSNSRERRYDDLLARYAGGAATEAELVELVWLRKDRRSALSVRTGLELLDEIRRHEAAAALTTAFEQYVRVVGPTRSKE